MTRRYYYDPADGRTIYVSSSKTTEYYPDWVDGDFGSIEDYYFPGGVPTARPAMTYTMSTATGTVDVGWNFAGFPDDSVLTLDGQESYLPDGDFTFTPTTVGSYLMIVHHPAHKKEMRYLDVN